MILDVNIREKSFGNKSLMNDVVFSIDDGEKVGIVGRNGIGKSTLFGILSGSDEDYTGEVVFHRGVVIAKTAQEHHGIGDQTLLEYILSGLPEYAKLSHIIETYPETMGENIKKITEYTDALARFDDLGYYLINEKVENELVNFGLYGKGHLKFSALSGGQKRMAEIVKIMHSNAHLALIDEPTNHMDYAAKDQFIEWMKNAREAVLVITHDRDVLEYVDRIIELKDGTTKIFKGNYDAYLKQNSSSTTGDISDYENVQRQLENAKKKVLQFQRMKEKARDPGTIRQFKGREERARAEVAELEKYEKPTIWIDRESAAKLDFKDAKAYKELKTKNIRINGINGVASRSSRILVEAQNLSVGYEKPLFINLNFQLRENEALELRGRNGAGKTTIVRAIIDAFNHKKSSTILDGKIEVDHTIKIGVYEQEISEKYLELPLAIAIEKLYTDQKLTISDTKIKKLMSDYLFDPIGDAIVPLSRLSGGQKARFQMISMMANDPQLLILDEPTNHLDLPSIEELENALQKFTGAILYVSHDNYFRKYLDGEIIEIL